MIIWSGQGYLVAAIVFIVSLLMNFIVDGIFGQGAYTQNSWGFVVALVISAPALWFLGNALQKNGERVVIDKETGQELTLRRSHTLFFIPIKYWAYIALAVAVIVAAADALGA